MIKQNKYKQFKLIILIANLILAFTIIVMLTKALNHIENTHIIAEYHNGDGLGGTNLIIQSNNTFIYTTYSDILPNSTLRGTWTKSNDTIVLNGSKCFNYINSFGDNKRECIEFNNAKFKMYIDSIVYISGKSNFTKINISYNRNENKKYVQSSKLKAEKSIKKFGERYSIIGDFNGDKVNDTIFESYINSETKLETYKILDTLNWDNDIELTIKNKPISLLYSSIKSVSHYLVTNNPQQKGIYLFTNLGDINDDNKDEFGFAVDWADYSNLNTYNIMTLNKNKFVKIFSFPIHETMSIDLDKPFNAKELVVKMGHKRIQYKYASMEEGGILIRTHKFK